MDVPQRAPAAAAPPSRRIHPLVAVACVSVAAASLIAAVQFLRPQDAHSASMQAVTAAATPPVPPSIAAAAPDPAQPSGGANATTPAPADGAAAAACIDCGVVTAVRPVRQKGEGTGAGAVAGGLVGGLAGHQFGRGGGKDVMTIAGAIGGAVAGHQIEKQVRAKTVYMVDVRMDNGTTRTMSYATLPGVTVGTRVRMQGSQMVVHG